MKQLIIRLIITVSIPIIVGVALVLLLFYKSLWNALYQWEDESLKWINQTQQQILHNSAYAQRLIETYSFDQLQLHLIVINSMIQKYYGSELKKNPKASFLKCSNKEFSNNECPQDAYTKLNQSTYYLDLYFVRERFSFNKLTAQQQEFIVMNEFISYYGKAAIIASNSGEFLKIQTIYNADTTSLMTYQPPRDLDFKDATYQTCLGTNYTEPYDPRCRQWYQYIQQHEGYFFYEPYMDAINGNLEMTISSQISQNSEFVSVSSIDYQMNSIIDLFKISLNQNAYSVLFHEFNNTIFSHPLLDASDITSWGDLEFKNLTENCQGAQALSDCLIEKQNFVQQLNNTVNFIQTQNYSIDQQINTDGLYQYWSRYGVDLISLVYPVRSQITKYPTQQPYSFSIVLTARVLVDESSSLKLFNVLNTNLIKIPLLIEFFVLSGIIVVFIVNYGNFQIYQIQYPIELLIIFLQKSLKEQQQFQNPNNFKSEGNQKEKNNNQITKYLNTINSPKLNKSLSKVNSSYYKSKIPLQDQSIQNSSLQNLKPKQIFIFQQNDKQTVQQDQNKLREINLNQDEIQETSSRLFQSQFKRDFLNDSNIMIKQSNQINHDSSIKKYNNLKRLLKENSSDMSQKKLNNYSYSVTDFQCIEESKNTTIMNNDFDQLSQIEQIEEKEKGQSKVLSGLKPLFHEMKIIKKTFQMLEKVINYQIQAYSNDQQDVMQTLFHFSKAKSTFQNLQNQTGLSRCYFNLGIIYLLKNEYEQSCEYFEASIMQSLQFIGLESLDQINENTFINIDNDQKDQLFIFCIIEKQNKNYQQAIEYFTQSLEYGTHFNPQLRQQTIVNLNYLFSKLCIQQNVIGEQLDKFDCNTPIDLVYVIQLDSISSYIIAESCLENIRKSKFFQKNDRIQIIIFNQELDVLLPYTRITSDHNWEDESLKWIKQTQQQILHNSAYAQCLIETYSFDQLQMHLIVINSIIQKYYGSKVKKNLKASFLKCSNKELSMNECPQDVYTKLNQSTYYVDLYFVREIFSFNKLTTQQQEFIVMNEFISYYGKAAIIASNSGEFLKIQTIYNADTTSLMTYQPPRDLDFKDTTYQTCLGTDFTEPYDPRCRQWYQYAQQHEGYFFYEPYLDAVNGNLEMTISSRINYNSEFVSVNSIDYQMNSIIDLFKTSQNQNAYSVLFHEFNNTIFYHPLLNVSDVTSWGDLEFKNLTESCQGAQALSDCMIEKQNFVQQLDNTVNFIQTQNYSIDQQINTDGLYQYWSRYGVDLISLVYPIRSQISKYPTQQPYSFSIVLTARILVDQSSQLKLFNILNANLIKIPLLIEFIVLSGLIVVFLVNYGNFQIYQIQYPIELLIIFLQKSLKEQQQFQNPNNFKSEGNEKEKNNNQITKYLNISNSPKLNKSQSKICSSQYKSKIPLQDQSILNISSFQNKTKYLFTFQQNDTQTVQQDQNYQRENILNQDEISETSSRIFLSQFKRDFLNDSNIMIKQSNQINHDSSIKKQNNLKRPFKENSSDMSQKRLINYNYSVKDFQHIEEQKNTTIMNNEFNQLSQIEQVEEKEKGQSKVLSGLKPLFHEMKIIKKTFQMLERVINYQIQAYSNDQQDVIKTLFHFSKAKSTFQNLQNQTGLSRCYFNLGIIYLLKNEYEQSCEYFEASIMQSLQFLGLESLDQINENMFINIDNDQKDQLFIFQCSNIFDSHVKDKKYFEQQKTKNIIIELLKTKQKFLSGIIEKQNKNYQQAIEYFTQSLEYGTHFNPQLRQQTIVNLNYLFSKLCIQQNVIGEQLDKFDCNTPIDLVYVIQLDSISSYIIAESCLENIRKSKFFQKNDRIQIIIFNQELDVLLPYTRITSDHNWQLLISSIKKIGINTIQSQQSDLKKLDWIQAINKTLDHVYEFKEFDLVQLNQIYKLNKKPIILHLKDQQSIINNNQQSQISSNFIEYEVFYEENRLIMQLNKLREQEILNPEYEFMAILNNY
ncbi:tetratricopeptide repeat protein (macronuclear) [Tetrahymena thermophila SB210]|uniref:Tetratricopeptide repeat protein n=1 Tax=Tetrahymena thermophila (strain SB210) TaxID=312017 RepID=A4VDV1_TETTS|nr:tetratricopeptide repeat protein [Tetrahymena thermophila SB210]EDK31710.2 tetratricopeptide repeat protein [Tetrahymena thermophila SB210]|eukprot:XP_001470802.2 tetratricopeptide repeat protein [Tetrahymena thermophila SB210]